MENKNILNLMIKKFQNYENILDHLMNMDQVFINKNYKYLVNN
jgi:hypothetical protein